MNGKCILNYSSIHYNYMTEHRFEYNTNLKKKKGENLLFNISAKISAKSYQK